MKKTAFYCFFALSIALVAVLTIHPINATGSRSPLQAGPGTTLPDSVRKFVQKVCMDCHADDGNFMAKGKINFSGWDKYDSAKQVSKANAMCKELTKSAMPPKKWRANNPDNIPTKAEVDMICRWANSLKK
jgi:hypothetical protein